MSKRHAGDDARDRVKKLLKIAADNGKIVSQETQIRFPLNQLSDFIESEIRREVHEKILSVLRNNQTIYYVDKWFTVTEGRSQS
jgi:hypothetical protein